MALRDNTRLKTDEKVEGRRRTETQEDWGRLRMTRVRGSMREKEGKEGRNDRLPGLPGEETGFLSEGSMSIVDIICNRKRNQNPYYT